MKPALSRTILCADAKVIPHVFQLLILKGSGGCRPFCSRPPLKMSDGPLAIFQAYLLLIGPHWHSSERLPMHHTSSLDRFKSPAASSVCVYRWILVMNCSVHESGKCWVLGVCVCVCLSVPLHICISEAVGMKSMCVSFQGFLSLAFDTLS